MLGETRKALSWTWFTRVSSQSNPADEPSRACHDLMVKLGAVRRQAVCPLTGVPLVELYKKRLMKRKWGMTEICDNGKLSVVPVSLETMNCCDM